MNKKNIILFILFFIILIGITTIIFICMNPRESINDKTLENTFVNIENSSSSNILENAVVEETSNITENNIITNEIVENTIVDNDTISLENNSNPLSVDKAIVKNTISTPSIDSTPITTPSSNQSATQTTIKEEEKTNTKVNTGNNNTKDEPIVNKEQSSTINSSQDTKKDTTTNVEHPELAYSTYRVTNTAILPEIISILKSEISKDNELVDFGTTAVSTNKTNAYNNTSGFTYLFVKDITKGKVAGNYQSFPERVRNTVGAFGTYYVYAEDEYTYDGRGLNPKWSQTLVWIYVKF